jgi:hypothetical protein
VQEGLSQRTVVLLNEDASVVDVAGEPGFKVFRTIGRFRKYVERECLAG